MPSASPLDAGCATRETSDGSVASRMLKPTKNASSRATSVIGQVQNAPSSASVIASSRIAPRNTGRTLSRFSPSKSGGSISTKEPSTTGR